MTTAFDDRLVRFEIFLPDESFVYDQQFSINASGSRYTNENYGECLIKLDNISKETRNNLIAKTTPWGKQRSLANVILSVGRKSYGTFQIFNGAMTACNITQPPDIGLIFQSSTGVATLGFSNAFSLPPMTTLRAVAEQVAVALTQANPNNPITLSFQSTQGNKNIANFSYTGAVNNLIGKLNQVGGIEAYLENNKLVIMDAGAPPDEAPIIEINKDTGMVGIPSITQSGISVRTLILNDISLYSKIRITSVENPMANGVWYVNQMQFDIASRDNAFYWILDCRQIVLGA